MKILLVCSAGMSTSILVKKMQEIAGPEDVIEAQALSKGIETINDWDVCLVGPQMKFAIPQLEKATNGKVPITDIPTHIYGLVDGKGTLELAKKLYEGK